jgi:outer membrane protein TolC
LDQGNDDSQAHLVLRKRLYDFGRSANAAEAAGLDSEGSRLLYEDALNQQRINIMLRYFDVLLADMRFIRNNEHMSIAYVQLDRARKRQELGQRSDIEILELEQVYQEVRRNLYSARADQRRMRARLANAINRPGELSADVAEPDLPMLKRQIPEVEDLQKEAIDFNPALRALQLRVKAAEARLAEARAGARPVLDSELRASEYQRELGSYNDFQALLRLDIPLWTGGSVDADMAKRQAELMAIRAEYRAQKMAVEQAVLEAWQDLDTLRVEVDEKTAMQDYRELYLDRSRTIYELEVKTDLGDSMVQVSDARLKMAETRYKIALTWARLDALLGKRVMESEQ